MGIKITKECTHGVKFDKNAESKHLSSYEIRKRYHRLFGNCPLGCGFSGIAYASMEHYVAGDW